MYTNRAEGSSAIALGVVPAPKPVATVFPVESVVITVPGTGVRAPVVVFCENPSTVALGETSWSTTYAKVAVLPVFARLTTIPTGLLPTFNVDAVPRLPSALIGKIVTPPGPGEAGEYSCCPFGPS